MKLQNFVKMAMLTLGLGLGNQVLAKGEVKADLFEQGSGRKVQLYSLNQDVEGPMDGRQEIKAVFSDMEGKPVFSEEAVVDNGKILKDTVVQHQTGETASIEVKDGMVNFWLKDKNGKEKKSSEKLKEPLLVAAGFAHFVKTNWETLAKGDAVEFRMAVWSRLDTVGFQFKKEKDEGEGDDKVLILKMKAASFIIAALVPPLYFKYSYKNHRIISYEGRISPKRKVGEDFKDQEAEVVYKFLD